MQERASGTHGPRQDDALKSELRSELRANRPTRAEEWREPEMPAEDEPEADQAFESRVEEAPPREDWEAIERRSNLARHLDRHAFPGNRAHLAEILAVNRADQRLLDLVSSLPDGVTFANFHELLEALGMPIEERPTGHPAT
jgi:hypothetical protein